MPPAAPLSGPSSWSRMVLEPVTAGLDLGREMLEIGLWPGRHHPLAPTPRAAARRARTRGRRRHAPRGRVRRHQRDGPGRRRDTLALPRRVVRLRSAASTMLHHVPTAAGCQFAILSETHRVLRPRRRALVGAEEASRARDCTSSMRETRTNPIDPARLLKSSCRRPGSGRFAMVSAGDGILVHRSQVIPKKGAAE